MTSSNFYISTDPSKMDIAFIYDYISNSYWSKGIPKTLLEKAIVNSFCFGIFRKENHQQVAFARVITDYATYAYIADVFVNEALQGNGLGQNLIKTIVEHPDLSAIRSFNLYTADAHSLYEKFGFSRVEDGTAMKWKPFKSYDDERFKI